MTELFLKSGNSEWQHVNFLDTENIRLTIENTFFENSGSYTLDVTLPLHTPENLSFFGAINRLDTSKRYRSFETMMIADSRVVFKGTGRITSITDTEAKIQMLSGNSSVKFWTKAQKLYIDELHFEYTDNRSSFDDYVAGDGFDGVSIINAGSFPGRKGIFCYVPVLDENDPGSESELSNGLLNEHRLMINNDEFVVITHGGTDGDDPEYIEVCRDSICPNLMFVTRWIFEHLGYTINRNDRNEDLVNSIYIATARKTTVKSTHYNNKSSSEEMAMAKALPHWTVEEFIKQLQNFLNVTVVFNDIDGTVDIVSSAYTDGEIDITSSVVEQFEVDMIDDEDVNENLYDSNVKYKEGASDYHTIDMVDREIIKTFQEIRCSFQEFLSQWDSMSDEEKKITIWTTEEGQYCAKIIDGGNNTESMERIRFNHFGSLERNTVNENDVELKISPVATTTEVEMRIFTYYSSGGRIYRDAFERKGTCKQTVLCLQNQFEAVNKSTVWDAINGEQENETEKEDIMQVFLMDDKAVPSGFYHLTYQIPFTHWDYNRPRDSVNHKSWSLSLDHDNSDNFIGKYHLSSRRQNRNAEHRIKFLSDMIPSVFSIYIIRNKRYACKKLEVQFSNKGMEKLISGNFEEIL